jgi:hypothetical protein
MPNDTERGNGIEDCASNQTPPNYFIGWRIAGMECAALGLAVVVGNGAAYLMAFVFGLAAGACLHKGFEWIDYDDTRRTDGGA